MAELLVTAGGLAATGGLAWLFFGARTAGRSELREGIQDGEVVALAAGALYPFLGIRLSPIVAAAAMALSSLSVVTNANRLRAWRRPGARVARG